MFLTSPQGFFQNELIGNSSDLWVINLIAINFVRTTVDGRRILEEERRGVAAQNRISLWLRDLVHNIHNCKRWDLDGEMERGLRAGTSAIKLAIRRKNSEVDR
jgi:hypothetical protein